MNVDTPKHHITRPPRGDTVYCGARYPDHVVTVEESREADVLLCRQCSRNLAIYEGTHDVHLVRIESALVRRVAEIHEAPLCQRCHRHVHRTRCPLVDPAPGDALLSDGRVVVVEVVCRVPRTGLYHVTAWGQGHATAWQGDIAAWRQQCVDVEVLHVAPDKASHIAETAGVEDEEGP
jgi:hypothetical protein